MKLYKLKLQEFRGYEEVEILFEKNLTTIVGLNDVGKSTILEALDIFFNEKKAVTPITFEDYRKNSVRNKISLTCEFNEIDEISITLDSTSPTTLKKEFLLTKDNCLSITKEWSVNCDEEKISAAKVFINCSHFNAGSNCELLASKKNKDLKEMYLKVLSDNGINDQKKQVQEIALFLNKIGVSDVSQTNNSQLRHFIYSYFSNEKQNLEDRTIEINKLDGGTSAGETRLSDKILLLLPAYALFKSDRPMNDKEAEIQDPVTQIIRNTLKEKQQELEILKNEIKLKAQELADKTIEKMGQINPDLAKGLVSEFETEDFSKGLKMSIKDDKGVPLNKRGSGVRRLLLFSFFRAEAEDRAIKNKKFDIIYAVEEVETSQNPQSQKEIIKSLQSLANESSNLQIIITTHSPELCGEVKLSSLRYVYRDIEDTQGVQNLCELEMKERNEYFQKICTNLGIFGDIISDEDKLIFACEGKTDKKYFQHFYRLLHEESIILTQIQLKDIIFLPCGGDNLKEIMNMKCLGAFKHKKFLLVDGDKESYRIIVNKINDIKDPNFKAKVTDLYTIENYFGSIKEIAELDFCGWSINPQTEINIEREDLRTKKLVAFIQKNLIKTNVSSNSGKPGEDKIKEILCSNRQLITIESLKRSDLYEEIESWFKIISELLYNKPTDGLNKDKISQLTDLEDPIKYQQNVLF